MKSVLIVSGIWPPDVGGPASHAPELTSFLLDRGYDVEVVVTADRAPATEPYPVRWISRRLPPGARHLAVVIEVTRRARRADVVYATSMHGRASLATLVAGRPLVVKLVADEAYERARRRGLFDGSLADFQRWRGGARVELLRRMRAWALRRVDHLVCPSSYLADLAVSWGVPGSRVSVLPNPAPVVPPLRARDELRQELGIRGRTLGFAGRLTRQKALDVAFEALSSVDDIILLVVGDGPDRARLENLARAQGLGERVRFLGPADRQRVLEVFHAVDASILSSAWENFPHTIVEALAVGTPVIATATGGVGEIVRDGENGLLVPPGDPPALARAIRRFFSEPGLAPSLASAAAGSVAHLSTDRIYERLERVLQDAGR